MEFFSGILMFSYQFGHLNRQQMAKGATSLYFLYIYKTTVESYFCGIFGGKKTLFRYFVLIHFLFMMMMFGGLLKQN